MGSRHAIACGSYQQIGERTTGIARALATLASSSPSRDIPNKMKQTRLFETVGPRRKKPDGNTELFEVPAGLHQLNLAPSRRLKGEGRRVQDDVAPRATPAAVGFHPIRCEGR